MGKSSVDRIPYSLKIHFLSSLKSDPTAFSSDVQSMSEISWVYSLSIVFFYQSVKLLYNKRKLLYCVKFCFLFLKNRVNRASWEREILDETESSGTLEIAPFNASTYLNTPKPWLLRAPKMHKNPKKRIAADKRIKRARLIEFRTLS